MGRIGVNDILVFVGLEEIGWKKEDRRRRRQRRVKGMM